MGGVEHATPAMMLVLFFVLTPIILFIRSSRTNSKSVYIRRIPGIDSIDDSLGSSVEKGRPFTFCTGMTQVGPVLYACLGVLYYIARKAARFNTNLFVPQIAPDAMAIVEDTVREGYVAESRVSKFDPHTILFLSEDQFAYASGYIGLVHREKVGAAFLFGSFAAESLILAEAGQQVGAMQVAASVGPEQVAFFICTCDYTLIGEELFAASAYLSREPVQVGSLRGQDRAKLLFLVLIVVGVGVATWNSICPHYSIPNLDQILLWNWEDFVKV
jgi:hypothetical protein